MYLIYIHTDPCTTWVRYVGLTKSGYGRFQQHLLGRGHSPSHRRWMQEVEQAGDMVSVDIIDKACSLEEARNKEAYWIRYFDHFGHLINTTFPSTSLFAPSSQTPGLFELDFPSGKVDEYTILFSTHLWHRDARFGGLVSFPSIDQSLLYLYTYTPWYYHYFALLWAKAEWKKKALPCYRYRLYNGAWATFGNKEFLTRRLSACDEVDVSYLGRKYI